MAEQDPENGTETNQQAEKDRQRSPAYPSIPLSEAIDKVKIIYDQDGNAPGTMEVIASHLESSPKSSGFLQAISSIVRYGLLEELEGKPRRLKASKLAIDILLLPEADPKRANAIKEAALSPKPFRELWGTYGIKLPSDQNLVHTLVSEKQFRKNTAEDLIKQYKNTIAFAKLGEGDKLYKNDSGDFLKPPAPKPLSDEFSHFFRQSGAGKAERAKDVTQTEPTEDALTLDEGRVVFFRPAKISKASFEDLKDWMEIQLRRIERNLQKPASSEEEKPQN